MPQMPYPLVVHLEVSKEKVSCECGLKWTVPEMNMVSNELVSIVMEPIEPDTALRNNGRVLMRASNSLLRN